MTDPKNAIIIEGNKYQFPNGVVCTISPDDLINPIGTGVFGIVYKAYNQLNQPLAIKKISKSGGMEGEKIKQEIGIMEKNAIIRDVTIQKEILGCSAENLSQLEAYGEDDTNYYIALKPFPNKGSLTELIDSNKITSQNHAIQIFKQVCNGIKSLHSRKILYRNLTTDNIFLCTEKAFIMNLEIDKSKEPSDLSTDTQSIIAPEVFDGDVTEEADVYSLGCVLYKMLTGEDIFYGASTKEIKDMKAISGFTVKSRMGELSKDILAILEGCLQYDKSKRIKANQLFEMLNTLKIDEKGGSQTINLLEFVRNIPKYKINKKRRDNKIGNHVNEINELQHQKYPFGIIGCVILILIAVCGFVYFSSSAKQISFKPLQKHLT